MFPSSTLFVLIDQPQLCRRMAAVQADGGELHVVTATMVVIFDITYGLGRRGYNHIAAIGASQLPTGEPGIVVVVVYMVPVRLARPGQCLHIVFLSWCPACIPAFQTAEVIIPVDGDYRIV